MTQTADLVAHRNGHLHDNKTGLQNVAEFHVAELKTAHHHFELVVDVLDRYATAHGFFAINFKVPSVVWGLDEVVFVHHVAGLGKNFSQIFGNLTAGCGVGSVDFSHQRLQHGRSRRHFHHLDIGPHRLGDRRQHFACCNGHFMRTAVAHGFVQQLNLDIALPGFLAQVIMAHQTVEVERRRRTGIGLNRGDFGKLQHFVGQGLHDVGGDRQRRTFRHVHHHVEFRFVVQRQHLHRYRRGVEQCKTSKQNGQHRQAENAILGLAFDERHQQVMEEPIQPRLLLMFLTLRPSQRRNRRANAHGQPWRENKCGEQREDHRNRPQHRDRRHIRPHHTRHKAHRQQRRDNRESRQDGRVADFRHRRDGFFGVHAALEQPPAVDVFNHDDGVINQNTDREDQSKQRNPVDGEAHQPCREYRHQDHHRNDDQHHNGRAVAEEHPDQHRHRRRGDEQLKDQFVHFFVGGFAVVAGDRNLDVVGNDAALQIVDLGQHFLGHGDTIGAGFLGHRNGHRWRTARSQHVAHAVSRAGEVLHQIFGVFGSLAHLRHIAHIDRAVVVHANDQTFHIVGLGQERAGKHLHDFARRFQAACFFFRVGAANGLRHLSGADAVTGQTFRQNLDPQLFGTAADDVALRRVGHFLEALHDVKRHHAQGRVIDVVRPHGQRHHRHIVNAFRLDQRLRYTWGNFVHVGHQLVIQLDQRGFHGLADLELHRNHAAAVARHGIDVFDAGDFAHQAFQRINGQTGYLVRRSAGIAEEHVHHGYGNLRVFLTRGEQQPHDADGKAGQQQQQRQGRMDELLRHGAGNAQPIVRVGTAAIFTVGRIVGHGFRLYPAVFLLH